MFDALIIKYGQLFQMFQAAGSDGYKIINGTVPLKLLYEKYLSFLKQGLKPIEELTDKEKQFFWNVAMKYYPDKETRIQASKASYVLWVITNDKEDVNI